LAEPPAVHGIEPIRGLEKFDCQRHQKIIEEEINRKLQYWLVR
jgi:hypothetical protein